MGAPFVPPVYQVGAWAAGGAGGQTDANGVVWNVNPQGVTGVFDSAPNRLNQTPFNEYDGAQRSRNYDNPLPITIQGSAQGFTAAGVAASRRSFAGLFAGGGQQTMSITDIDGVVLTVTVEKNGAPKVTPQSAGLDFDWQLNVIAADPRKYLPVSSSSTPLPSSSGGLDWSTGGGLDWSTGGGLNWGVAGSNGLLQLTNTGTADAWPVFTITAPTDGSTLVNPTIVNQNTGQMLQYVDTLFLGDVVVINTSPYNKSVTKNGQPYRRNLQVAQYFKVPAGQSIQIQFQGTSLSTTPQLSAALASAVYA
jgi:Phage tail protein